MYEVASGGGHCTPPHDATMCSTPLEKKAADCTEAEQTEHPDVTKNTTMINRELHNQ